MDKRILLLREKYLSKLQKPPAITQTAKEMNLSPSRLRQLFKIELGTSPTEYLKDLRLEKASELLTTTHLRVKDISWQVGIRDQSNFVRDFKKKYGTTPTEHRRKHHKLSGDGESD